MNRKIWAAALALSVSATAFAQKSVNFVIRYLPNKQYDMTSRMNMDMTMDMKGDSGMLSKAKANGSPFPMTVKMDMTMKAQAVTGAKSGSPATFPLEMSVTSIDSRQTMNGQDMNIPMNGMTGQKISVICDANGKMLPQDATGTDQQAVMKAAVTKMITGFQDMVKFPEKPLAIGESFIQDMPFNMAIPGLDASAMKFKATYKLTAINNGIASFDYDQHMDMNLAMPGAAANMKVSGEGKGNGVLKFDIANMNVTDMTGTMEVNYHMDMGQGTMQGAVKGTTNYHIDITGK